MHHVAVISSWILTLQINLDWMGFSINVHPNSFFDEKMNKRQNVLNENFFWRFCDVFVDPIHNTNPWNCLVFKQGINHDINTMTFFVRIDFHIQDLVDFRIRTNPPSRSGCFEISRLCVFSTCCLHNLGSFFICNEELSFLNCLSETSVGAEFRQFLIIRKFCEFPFVFLQQVPLCQWCWTLRYGAGIGNLSRYH